MEKTALRHEKIFCEVCMRVEADMMPVSTKIKSKNYRFPTLTPKIGSIFFAHMAWETINHSTFIIR